MNEIERKFLVKNTNYREGAIKNSMKQGYIANSPKKSIRVRIGDTKAFLNIKGAITGITRPEFEYEIPLSDAVELLERFAEGPIIEKIRYVVEYEGFKWEIDEFGGENQGLIVAEIELSSEEEYFEKPSWIGEEVTNDLRYLNTNLSIHPFKTWEENQ